MDDSILFGIAGCERIFKAYVGAFEATAREYGLTRCECEVLIYLSLDRKSSTCTDISRFWGVSKALVSRSVETLFEKNMIAIIPQLDDKRYMHVMVDEAALPIIERFGKIRREFGEKMLVGVTEDEYEMFRRVLTTMYRNAEQHAAAEKDI